MRAHHGYRLKESRDRARWEWEGHSRQKQSSSTSHTNSGPSLDELVSHDPVYDSPLFALVSSLPFQPQESRLTLKLIKILIQGESVSGIAHNKGKLRPIKTGLRRKRRFGCGLNSMTIFTPLFRGQTESVTLQSDQKCSTWRSITG